MKKSIILIIVFVLSMIFIFYKSFQDSENIFKNAKYTVALITSERHGKTTFKNFGNDFEIIVNGKRYEGQTTMDVVKGNSYLAIYDSLNPNNKNILFYSLKEDITPPPNGWKYEDVPIPIDSTEIKQFLTKLR